LDVAPLILKGYGISNRETEISELVLRGLSTEQIAHDAYISSDTVQDHLKSIFDKMGVHSRRELVATVFEQRYLPHMKAGFSASAKGWFRTP